MAMQEMERYCTTHPNAPVSLRHPRLFIRGRTFVALLGPSIEEGIAGFGDTVQAALRAFDVFAFSNAVPSGIIPKRLFFAFTRNRTPTAARLRTGRRLTTYVARRFP
jgi:hypothetical protein